MVLRHLLCRAVRWALPVLGVACAPIAVSAEAGYARLAIVGNLSLSSSGGGANAQDIDSAFGLGDARDCPYGRIKLDAGLPEFGVTAFLLRESGSGTLSETFGGIPAGTTVTSDLEIGVAKCTGALGFDLGPVHVAPGVLFDVFAIDFRAASSPGNREEVDDIVAVPIPYVGIEAPVFGVRACLEIGYLDPPDFAGFDGRFTDLEASVRWEPVPYAQLQAGYRYLAVVGEGEGDTSADAVGLDLRITGWFAGIGIRF